MQLVRSLIFTLCFFLSTTVYAVVVLLLCWLPHRHLWRLARSWASLNLRLLEKLCGLNFVVEGRENIPLGNHIAMWKHSSSWETVAQAYIFPPQAWVLKRELMWIPIVGWALHFMRPIAINRKAGHSAVNQVLAQGKERLDAGLWILIFPEGTRTAAGEQRKYGISGALLACQTGVSVIPVAHNAGEFWPRRGWIKRPGTIRVVIGPPIATLGRAPRDINTEVQNWIEARLAEMQGSTVSPAPQRVA